MSNVLNLSVDQGTDFFRLLTFKDNLDVPIDLTGFTFEGKGRFNYSDPSAAFTMSFVLRDQVTNTGEVEMWIYKDQTTPININQASRLFYDVERTSAGDITDRVMQGVITLNPEATK